MQASVETLDQHLSSSNADSMEWCDGLGHETANELLSKLQEVEWVELQSLCDIRSVSWRECLASALSPHQGQAAEKLLFMLANDEYGEVGFHAISTIAFYCGVNAKAGSAFIDGCIQLLPFLASARLVPELPAAIQRLSAKSSGHFQHQFELLMKEIQA